MKNLKKIIKETTFKPGMKIVFKSESPGNKLGYRMRKGRICGIDKSGLILVGTNDKEYHLIDKELISLEKKDLP